MKYNLMRPIALLQAGASHSAGENPQMPSQSFGEGIRSVTPIYMVDIHARTRERREDLGLCH